MDSRERLSAVFSGTRPDRVPYQDAFWRTTVERWQAEGLSPKVTPEEHFGCEMAGLGGDYTLRFPVRTLAQTERYRVYVDADGATRRELRTGDGWTPHWLDFAIKSRTDWLRHRERSRFEPGRLADDLADSYAEARRRGRFVVFRAHACFHPTWHKIGLERLLVAMIEEPGWIEAMFAAHTQLVIELYEGCKSRGVRFDAAWLADDLGYRTAPLISPRMYRDLVQPHHRQACRHFAADGLRTILHSDGDVRPLIPDFLEAGFCCLHPLEVKAGLDVAELKARYGPALVCFGNIDARALAGTRAQIEVEIRRKLEAGMRDGGYIFHTDHSVPSDVSFGNYSFAVSLLSEYGRYE